ncbi:MAG: redoxin domain-containing protein [Gemmatimonadaceae bacterium]
MFAQQPYDRRRFLGVGALSLAAAWVGTRDSVMQLVTVKPFVPSSASDLASLGRATAWLNSAPLTAADLQGRVVLVDFWTYTCINWLRTVPYVRAWAARYKERGLVVIGVHTPEFTFEEDVDNVRRSVQERGITYPIAIDNDRAIWHGFGNHYWPALYFIDGGGMVRGHHFGEGNYEESEMRIRELVAASGRGGAIERESVSPEAHGPEVGADWGSLRSPETYVGHQKAENFSSPGGASVNTSHLYAVPPRLRLNQWALSGEWTVKGETAALNAAGGRIAYRFHARDLHLIMGPAVGRGAVPFRVSIDGQPPGAIHGSDVDEHGTGTVREQRLYQLIRQSGPIADRQFEIEFIEGGVEAYAFTFG